MATKKSPAKAPAAETRPMSTKAKPSTATKPKRTHPPSAAVRAARHEAKMASAAADPRSVAQLWDAIERARAAGYPTFDLKLRPGASEQEIASAEATLGMRFPGDFRASIALHDGQEVDDEGFVTWLPVAQRLGSLASLVRCWEDERPFVDAAMLAERSDWLDRGERVRQVHFHPRHIPFAGSRFWDYGRLLLDLAPGPKGTEGQVIARDDVDLVWVAPSFRALLASVVRDLEDGTLTLERMDG